MAHNGERLLRAVSETPWAIMPEKLDAILDVIELRLSGADLRPEDVRGQFGRVKSAKMADQAGGVVVLPLVGVISQRMNMLTNFSGGTSTEQFGARFDQLMANGDVSAIVIDVDSPGGNVEGVDELSQKIFEARESGEKRIIAVVNSLMASAAYWIGSAADEVVVTPSGQVGSIGVFAVHTEFSRLEEAAGITRTLVKAGEFKAELNNFEPLSDEAEGHMQETVDEYFRMFVEAVARNRGVTEASVRGGLGRGRVLPARQAVDEGLVDRIASLEDVLEELGVEGGRTARARTQAAASAEGSEPVAATEAAETERSGSGTMSTDGKTEVEAEGNDGADPSEISSEAPDTDAAPQAVEEDAMPEQDQDTAARGGVATVERDPLVAERKRAARINRLCAMHGMSDKASEFIEGGLTVGEVQDNIFEAQGDPKPVNPEPQKVVDMSRREERKYSIVRAMRAAIDNDWSKAGFEREIHQEIAGKLDRGSRGGFYVPTHLGPAAPGPEHVTAEHGVRPQAALETGTATAGQEFVFTEPGSFIDMLRTRMVTTALGATFLPGLEGNVDFPKQSAAGSFTWRAEDPGSDVADSDATTDQVSLRPNDGTSSTAYSRRFLAQSVIDVEQFVRNDLAAIVARGIDKAALHGAGGNEPTGIYQATGVNVTDFADALTWGAIVDMETQVAADDADIGVMAYATTPEVRGAAKTTEKATGTAQFLWTGSIREGEMNGFRAMASNQIRKDLGAEATPVDHGIIFGVWDQLLIGEWGAMEIVVDPFSKKKQGLVEVTVFVIADVALRHPEAFTKGTNLTI